VSPPRGHYVEKIWEADFARESGRAGKGGHYEAFVPDPIAEYEPALESATSALGERAAVAVRDLNADSASLLTLEGLGRQLLRSEALASSQIEGLNISHRKLAEADLTDRDGHFKAREIRANVLALEEATRIGAEAEEIDIEAITAIHSQIALAGPLEQIAGEIRQGASWIGGNSPLEAEYVGPPWEDVRPLLEDLCEFVNRDDVSPVAQAAIAHAQFETIHPFGDGNGRVGRCLIQVILTRRGLSPRHIPPVSVVLGADKDSYIAGLIAFREGRVDSWVRQFARAVELAAEQALTFSRQVADLRSEWRDRLGRVREDAAVLPLIDALAKYPVITATVAEAEVERTRPAIINGLARLEQVGAVTRHRNQKKGDSWEAKELFRLLDSFEKSVRKPRG
jgi:Fic family protein